MTTSYTFFADLATEAPIPARGILSQTLSNDGDIEFLLFAFAAGEQLSEHTSARPAIIHILGVEGELAVGGDAYPARPGTWLRMAPDVKHSLVAKTPLQMALSLLPRERAGHDPAIVWEYKSPSQPHERRHTVVSRPH